MLRKATGLVAASVSSCLLLAPVGGAFAQGAPPLQVAVARKAAKPLNATVEKGLEWLVKTQLANGGWGQGEESAHMGSNQAIAHVGSVADSGTALLALSRAGNTAASGKYADAVRRGVEFMLTEIEAADADSMYVTQNRSTRVQAKIGAYIDTFIASMVLAEIKGKTGIPKLDQRVDAALVKVLRKIDKNQRADGSWDDRGWAPALSQAVAAKGINRAAQVGAPASEAMRRKTEQYAAAQYDQAGRGFGGGGSAGVDLYATAATVSGMNDNMTTNEMATQRLQREAATGDAPTREKAQAELRRNEQAKVATTSANMALVAKLEDPAFVSGFGSNGGEEFLSYMLIAESLLAKGGDEWKKWDDSMSQNLTRVQNGDGSWAGHHCITGRTFCTATALLVLMADRAPVPMAEKLGARG